MRALVAKEMRLLMPAWLAAAGLALVTIWFSSKEWALLLLWLGMALLGLSTFGREFGLGVFGSVLAMPMERGRMWTTKLAVLGGAMISIWLLWITGCYLGIANIQSDYVHWNIWDVAFVPAILPALAVVTGAIWTTICLRQVAGAFWIAALLPSLFLPILSSENGANLTCFYVALGIYSAAGLGLAWWLFYRAQEVGWTGGTVNWPWASAKGETLECARSRRPFLALVRKEIQLNFTALAGMAAFFVLHVIVVLVRKPNLTNVPSTAFDIATQFVGALWLFVPPFVVAPMVAEERRMGTLGMVFSLPAPRWRQYLLKFGMAILLGGILCALGLWTAEGISSLIQSSSYVARDHFPLLTTAFNMQELARWCLIFSGLSILTFYGSTLTNGLLQAVGAAVLAALVILCPTVLGRTLGQFLGRGGFLASDLASLATLVVGLPVVLWLTWSNFRKAATGRRLWLGNLTTMLVVQFLAVGACAVLYYRAWEYFTPLETPHGPARIEAGDGSVSLSLNLSDRALIARLPDGRVWEAPLQLRDGKTLSSIGNYSAEVDAHFLEGSNWVSLTEISIARMFPLEPGGDPRTNIFAGRRIESTTVHADGTRQTYFVSGRQNQSVGLRADGTLWVSEKPDQVLFRRSSLYPEMGTRSTLVQYGQQTNWLAAVRPPAGSWYGMLLLKRDGSMWSWNMDTPMPGTESNWPGLQGAMPVRIGDETNWASLFPTPRGVFAWKKDGTAWILNFYRNLTDRPDPGEWATALPELDGVDVKQLLFDELGRFLTVLRKDGTIWRWWQATGTKVRFYRGAQLGKENHWKAMAECLAGLAALKDDGTVWLCKSSDRWQDGLHQLGTHSDWVGINGFLGDGIACVSADGTIWVWKIYSPIYYNAAWTLPSRKPYRLGSLF